MPKFLIAGLGNPGIEYEGTRHNAGFMVLDHLACKRELTFTSDRYGHTAMFSFKGNPIILLKPNTYMNLSGKAVRYHLETNRMQPGQLLVVLDDLALPLGKLRMKPSGSDGGHNGLKDINAVLGHPNYPRLRVGIGSDYPKGRQVDYVLGAFTPSEYEVLTPSLDKAVDMILGFVGIGINQTMTKYND